ncbi:MAG TPA: hypothetical protein VL866_17185, partial [Pyrinomonadaceae bacterium]|nr:hypothetical protein [Pyrinomonadaceae bacterium]
TSLDAAKIGDKDKIEGFQRLNRFVQMVETRLAPQVDFESLIEHEGRISPSLDGRSVFDDKRKRVQKAHAGQRSLF